MREVNLFILLLVLLPRTVAAQSDSTVWFPPPPAHYTFVKYNENTIEGTTRMDSFFHKLVELKHSRKGTVTIIHIGDSHLQADMMTAVVRNGFHDFFGNAGRGLVFPYQVAGSNAPHDVSSKSNATWKSNRLTSPDKPIKTGIIGYGMETPSRSATLELKLKEIDGKQERFNKMVFFLTALDASYKLTDSGLYSPLIFSTTDKAAQPSVVTTDSMLKGFDISRISGEGDFSFYGVSLENKNQSGILYHTIGVNGARYDQFPPSELLWEQLKALKGDLFIVSLGTNEAQNQYINEQTMMAACDSMVKKIHKIAPAAEILITTPCGSYFKAKKPNKSILSVSIALKKYCAAKNLPYWDLFSVCGGLEGVPALKKYDLLSHDLIHFNNAGYQLQGALLLDAFAKDYNKYEKKHPWKPAPVVVEHPQAPKPTAQPPKVKTVQNEVVKAKIVPIKPPSVDSAGTGKTPVGQSIPGLQAPEHKSKITVEYGN